MSKKIVSFYKFKKLNNIENLRNIIFRFMKKNSILGTIILAKEGININICGDSASVENAKDFIQTTLDLRIDHFNECEIDKDAFSKLKVKIKDEIIKGKKEMVDTESSMQAIFDHTADIKAQNRLLLWYTLMLTHLQQEGEDEPEAYFKGIDFEDKLEDYYLKEEEASDFYSQLVQKVTTVLAFWFYNQASTPDEFSSLLEKVEKGEI